MFPFCILLTVKGRRPDRLVLSPSLSYRAGFGLIFAAAVFVFLFGTLFDGDPGPFVPANVAPLLFLLASGLGLAYNDSWVFDRERGTIESHFGLLLVFRRRRMPLLDLRSVGIESFRKGRAGFAAGRGTSPADDAAGTQRGRAFFHMDRLVARDAQGVMHVLDTARGTHAARLQRTGRRIAAFCGVPFAAGP